MKKLSIITINYNDASGLEKTIKSVLCQTFDDFEYIVIDGNSTDGSKDIISKYKDQIDIAISEPDTGIYNAMNKGAAHANGEYLLFLNSGDNLKENNSLELLFKTKPSADIVCSVCIDYDNQKLYYKIPPENVSLYTFRGGSLPHPSSLIKKSIFNKVGGYKEEFKIISDWCFFVDALLIHKASYSTTDIELAEFNCYGISSTNPTKESYKQQEYLEDLFGRIMLDYPGVYYEAVFNVAYWSTTLKGFKRTLILFPFKVINRLMHLRNKTSKREGLVIKKIKL